MRSHCYLCRDKYFSSPELLVKGYCEDCCGLIRTEFEKRQLEIGGEDYIKNLDEIKSLLGRRAAAFLVLDRLYFNEIHFTGRSAEEKHLLFDRLSDLGERIINGFEDDDLQMLLNLRNYSMVFKP